MTVHYSDDLVTVYQGDCLEVLRADENGYDFALGYGTRHAIADNSVDSVVTDPPYGLSNTDTDHVNEALTHWLAGDREFIPDVGGGFMGNEWDEFVPPPAVWDEAMRVLKPGGHLVAFAGSRTMDLMTLSIRLAGFDIRDSIAWLYGTGFPKSVNVAKVISATELGFGGNTGAQRRAAMGDEYVESGRLGNRDGAGRRDTGMGGRELPLTENGKKWEGWGTALKPGFEPIVVARKPLAGTIAANVLEYGTGGINIGATRVPMNAADRDAARVPMRAASPAKSGTPAERAGEHFEPADAGRFPTNVILDGSQAAALDEQSGTLTSGLMKARTARAPRKGGTIYGADKRNITAGDTYGDSGGASRFFPTFDMTEEDWAWERRVASLPTFHYEAKAPTSERPSVDGVEHPTVKPLALMKWLVRLVTPKGGVVLELFAGSGTTIEAAIAEGFRCLACERETKYLPLIDARMHKPISQSLLGDWDGAA